MRLERLRLGIDVGGTNTDAVLMQGNQVVGAVKRFTTGDVSDGVVNAVRALLALDGVQPSAIEAVMIGTTQFVNAFIQRRDLAPVAAIRIGLPTGDGIPPFCDWPADARAAVGGRYWMIRGGAHHDGQEFAELDMDALATAVQDARSNGIDCFALSATFAPVRPDIEERAARLVRELAPGAHVTCSAQVGGLGILDRENAAIINASLAPLAVRVIGALRTAFDTLSIHAPLFISQNDGTLISTAMATEYPILTCSAGPTNSIRGAAFLSGLTDAIVADIGGTTTDIGFLRNGFPRETASPDRIGGVRTNFRMPDVLSIGLGGGSHVTEVDGRVRAGPRSVGYRLQTEGLVFGGSTLTATDIAVRSGHAEVGDPTLLAGVTDELVNHALDDMHAQIEEAIDQIKVSAAPLPLILVGGGSILVSRSLKGTSKTIRPENASVANAVGAAIALVSGRADRMFDYGKIGREAALKEARAEAVAAAVSAGAEAGEVEVVDVQELKLTHMESTMMQVKVRAVGPLALGSGLRLAVGGQ
ncbi:hydantoinase/oxoprolinase family protein [Sandaracinobacter neustonicus]|uniref:Hydantoinase/oxoprolinase family protein n=1 Tax=Sandaracinobacter neustonicus TaxID=1715348 RepID=A0A501XVZ5_9SPHN|nr:hydantoinase/oxoprolinase family protein [Sandaracinobacter neustonicus]TPE64952.1 hydantoinase/oxoprolinase family protein [Sandaracinobacter neustonicus]